MQVPTVQHNVHFGFKCFIQLAFSIFFCFFCFMWPRILVTGHVFFQVCFQMNPFRLKLRNSDSFNYYVMFIVRILEKFWLECFFFNHATIFSFLSLYQLFRVRIFFWLHYVWLFVFRKEKWFFSVSDGISMPTSAARNENLAFFQRFFYLH